MADVANLTVGINGTQAKLEATALTRKFRTLAVSGTKVTAASAGTSAALGKQAVATRVLGATTAKTALSTSALTSSIRSLALAAAGFAGFAVGAGVLGIATKNAAGFSIAIAEVNTLINESFGDINDLAKATENLARTFGTSTQQQAAALYQIISAGAKDASQAVELLDVTNQLALGGVADLAVAADGLTTVLNAYGLSAEDATDVSDTFFVAIREGKTTADELSSALGQIVPIAAQLGLSFQEVTSVLAGLTKSGINTRRSVTGLRAIIVSILKPTEQQKEIAEELGLEWDAAALKADGFVGIIRNMVAATGGNTEQMTQLLATTEALTPAFALAGQAGDDANATFLAMEDRAGATALAVNKISESLGQRLKVAGAGISATFEEIGLTLLEVLVPAIEGVNSSLNITLGLLRAVGVASAIAFGPQFLGGLGKTAGFLGRIVGLLKGAPIITFIGALTGLAIGLSAVSDELDGVNGDMELFEKVINGNATTLETWRAVVIAIFNDVGSASERLSNRVKDSFDDGFLDTLVKSSPSILSAIKLYQLIDGSLNELGRRVVRENEGGNLQISKNLQTIIEEAAEVDRLRKERRDSFRADSISQYQGTRGDNNLTFKAENDLSDEIRIRDYNDRRARGDIRYSRTPGTANTDLRQAGAINNEVNGKAFQRILELRRQLVVVEGNLQLTDEQRSKAITFYRRELTNLENPHKQYTDNLREQLRLAQIQDPAQRAVEASLSSYITKQKSEGIPVTEEAIATWRKLITETNELSKTFSDTGPLESYSKGLENLSEQFQNLAVTGIQGASDALADFVLSGTLDLENFGNVLRNIAQQITSLLIQRAVVGPIASLLPFADGGVFDNGKVSAFAKGGVVSSPTVFPFANGGIGLMAENEPEAILPLKRGPSGRLGVENFGDSGGGTYVTNLSVNVEGNVDSDARIVELARAVDTAVVSKIQDELRKANKSGGTNRR